MAPGGHRLVGRKLNAAQNLVGAHMEPDATATAQGVRTCLVQVHGAAVSFHDAIQAACCPSQLRVGDYLTSSDLCRFEAMGLTDGDRTQVEGHPHPGLNISLRRMVMLLSLIHI